MVIDISGLKLFLTLSLFVFYIHNGILLDTCPLPVLAVSGFY